MVSRQYYDIARSPYSIKDRIIGFEPMDLGSIPSMGVMIDWYKYLEFMVIIGTTIFISSACIAAFLRILLAIYYYEILVQIISFCDLIYTIAFIILIIPCINIFF